MVDTALAKVWAPAALSPCLQQWKQQRGMSHSPASCEDAIPLAEVRGRCSSGRCCGHSRQHSAYTAHLAERTTFRNAERCAVGMCRCSEPRLAFVFKMALLSLVER